jgi:hypothetical protein
MRVVALDVHRSFAQVAELEDGALRQRGRVDLVRHKVLEFARTLRPDDEVVLEATGNTMAIVRLLKPHVGRVVIANPLQVRVIAEAKAKTDRIDAAALARLHAAGYLPEVWQPDEATERLRRLVAVVQGMTRTENRVHAVLHANLIPRYSGKLFMAPGRRWLAEQPLAEDDRAAVDRWLAALDAMEKELTVAEADLAEDYAWARPALVAMKQRQMQLKAGAASRRGGNAPGPARDYSIRRCANRSGPGSSRRREPTRGSSRPGPRGRKRSGSERPGAARSRQ